MFTVKIGFLKKFDRVSLVTSSTAVNAIRRVPSYMCNPSLNQFVLSQGLLISLNSVAMYI